MSSSICYNRHIVNETISEAIVKAKTGGSIGFKAGVVAGALFSILEPEKDHCHGRNASRQIGCHFNEKFRDEDEFLSVFIHPQILIVFFAVIGGTVGVVGGATLGGLSQLHRRFSLWLYRDDFIGETAPSR